MTIVSDLDTAGVIAGGDKWTGRARGGALLHPRRLKKIWLENFSKEEYYLGQRLVMGLHPVDDNPPLAGSVDRS